MAVTLNFTQLKRKKRKNGEIPIYLRITEHRKSRYLSTGISVKEEDWNNNRQEIRKSHSLSKKYNLELSKFKLDAESKKSDLRLDEKLDAKSLKQELNSNNKNTIREFAEKYRERLKQDQRFWEYRHFGTIIKNLEEMGVLDQNLKTIDQAFIEDFKDYCSDELEHANNTVRKKMQRLKSMVIEALKNGLIRNNPFLFIEPIKREKSTKTKLSIEQIEAIESLQLNNDSSLWHVKNYFLFSFYMAGIRFSDLCRLEPKNIVDGRLKYRMCKTGNEKNMKLFGKAQEILNHYNTDSKGYIFPILDEVYTDELEVRKKISSKNVLINRDLKKLAEKAGIQENISFHVSRHSFANYALQKNMNIYDISKALGHNSLKITEIYLKSFDEEKLDSAMESLFSE